MSLKKDNIVFFQMTVKRSHGKLHITILEVQNIKITPGFDPLPSRDSPHLKPQGYSCCVKLFLQRKFFEIDSYILYSCFSMCFYIETCVTKSHESFISPKMQNQPLQF
jgi:hypothetical protein